MRIPRYIVLLAVIVFSAVKGFGQKTDYTWLTGYESYAGYDTVYQHWFGISKFDFNQPNVAITRDSLGINFDSSNSTISDSNGNVLFYCNGVRINNSFDQLMVNGDSLSEGYFLNVLYTTAYQLGIPYPQYHLVLANPNDAGKYDIFHLYVDTFAGGNADLGVKNLLHSSIDVYANNDSGLVLPKNISIIDHEIGAAVCATKHGNGRDWWICTYQVGTNCFDMLLYNGSDTLPSHSTCGGMGFQHPHYESMRFSPDGSRFVLASDSGYICFYDFDRCNGTLSFLDTLHIPQIVDSSWVPWGVEFSPNSRFVYVFCQFKIFQFDMSASPIGNSIQTIATYNPSDGPYPMNYFHAQLAPDGKIYVNSGNTDYFIGVINNPDGEGSACNYLDHSISLPTFISCLPYYPDYRLGALSASACDSLSGLTEVARAAKEAILKVYPNPASDYVMVDYGFTDWSKNGAVSLEICDELGQAVYEQILPQYSGFQKLDFTKFAAGVYTAFIRRNGQMIATQKFAKD